MTHGRLVSLSASQGQALETFLSEFDETPEHLHGYFCDRQATIEKALATLEAWTQGQQLPDGWVPNSTWFWEGAGELQGVINLRHHLTPWLEENGGHIGYSVAPSHRNKGVATAMLGAVLEHCQTQDISQILLVCDAENLGSIRVIETHGGVLERQKWNELMARNQRWYHINFKWGVADHQN